MPNASNKGNPTFSDLPIGSVYTPESQWPEEGKRNARIKISDTASIAYTDRDKPEPKQRKPKTTGFVVWHS